MEKELLEGVRALRDKADQLIASGEAANGRHIAIVKSKLEEAMLWLSAHTGGLL